MFIKHLVAYLSSAKRKFCIVSHTGVGYLAEPDYTEEVLKFDVSDESIK